MATNSVPEKAAKTGQVQQPSLLNRFVDQIKGEAELTKTMTSSDVASRVTEKMLEADSLEDAIAAQDSGMPSGKDLVDVEMQVNDFDTLPSSEQFSEGSPLGVYLLVHAVKLEDGSPLEFSTGAPNIVTLLHKARKLDRLPLDCVIRSKPTSNGALLTLKLLPKRVIR